MSQTLLCFKAGCYDFGVHKNASDSSVVITVSSASHPTWAELLDLDNCISLAVLQKGLAKCTVYFASDSFPCELMRAFGSAVPLGEAGRFSAFLTNTVSFLHCCFLFPRANRESSERDEDMRRPNLSFRAPPSIPSPDPPPTFAYDPNLDLALNVMINKLKHIVPCVHYVDTPVELWDAEWPAKMDAFFARKSMPDYIANAVRNGIEDTGWSINAVCNFMQAKLPRELAPHGLELDPAATALIDELRSILPDIPLASRVPKLDPAATALIDELRSIFPDIPDVMSIKFRAPEWQVKMDAFFARKSMPDYIANAVRNGIEDTGWSINAVCNFIQAELSRGSSAPWQRV